MHSHVYSHKITRVFKRYIIHINLRTRVQLDKDTYEFEHKYCETTTHNHRLDPFIMKNEGLFTHEEANIIVYH